MLRINNNTKLVKEDTWINNIDENNTSKSNVINFSDLKPNNVTWKTGFNKPNYYKEFIKSYDTWKDLYLQHP